jgi:hypothetical protein
MIIKCGAVGEMKSDGKTEEIRENMPQCHSFHHKSHIN